MSKQSPSLLLDGYVPLTEAARQPHMPSLRTLQRMVQHRELPVTYIGRRPFINVSSFRELLAAREIQPIGPRRQPRASR